MSFTTPQAYLEAKKLFETYDQRVADNSLDVDELWNEQLAIKIREQRDELLAVSDWTQLPDSPADKEAWATYRQALRDLPTVAGFPNVAMPTAPA